MMKIIDCRCTANQKHHQHRSTFDEPKPNESIAAVQRIKRTNTTNETFDEAKPNESIAAVQRIERTITINELFDESKPNKSIAAV